MKLFKNVSGWRKYYIITIIPIMLVAIVYGFYHDFTKYDHLIMIVNSSEVYMQVKKARIDRTIIILNDTLMIPSYTRLAINYKNDFDSLESSKTKFDISKIAAPYLLIKDRDSLIVKVVKQKDTLFFKLEDPDKRDLSDPTFKDLYDYMFETK